MKNPLFFVGRVMIMIFGIALLSFSIAALYWVGLGSDPTSVCVDGLHHYFGFSHGLGSSIVNFVLLAILFIIGRSKIGIATVVSSIIIGPFIGLFEKYLFASLPPNSNLALGLIIVLLSVLINATGLGLYLAMDVGASSFDGIILTMSDVFSLSYRASLSVFYSGLLLIGLILGGVWGIGTLIYLALSGWLFERTYGYFLRSLSFLRKA